MSKRQSVYFFDTIKSKTKGYASVDYEFKENRRADLVKLDFIRCEENDFTISEENLENEIIVEKIPVAFEVKGKGKQHFYGVVNMPNFDVNKFYRNADPSFIADEDCLDVVDQKIFMSLENSLELQNLILEA